MKKSLHSTFDEISFNRLQNLLNFEGQNFVASALASRVLASASRVLASASRVLASASRVLASASRVLASLTSLPNRLLVTHTAIDHAGPTAKIVQLSLGATHSQLNRRSIVSLQDFKQKTARLYKLTEYIPHVGYSCILSNKS